MPDAVWDQTTTNVAREKLGHVREALAQVLAGGPYEPEFAVSEGTACTLSIAGKGSPAFFAIAKSNSANADAVSALVKAL